MMRWLLSLLAVFGWALAQFKSEYKLSVVVAPNTPWGMGAQRFADLVREKTEGKINIKVYYSGQLFAGQQTNEFQLLRSGVADFAIGSTINWSPQVKELNLFNLPFFFPSYKELDAVKVGQRYLTVWNYVIDPLIFAASVQTWRSFPAEVQKAIQEAALEAARYQTALARAGMDDGTSARYLASIGVKVEIPEPIAHLRNQGVQVTALSPLEIGRFRDRVAGVVQRWMNEIGGTLVVQAEADKKRAR
jgi:TRAP-type C4-dicarboxylate transport system substrate-binding protein